MFPSQCYFEIIHDGVAQVVATGFEHKSRSPNIGYMAKFINYDAILQPFISLENWKSDLVNLIRV